MKINIDTVYHVPTSKLRNHFLEQCQNEGFVWHSGKMPIERIAEEMYGGDTCIAISETGRMGFGRIIDFMCYQDIIPYAITPTPQIIKLNGLKIVYNPPYTIVTDGTFKGKAKCNPADEYDPVEGLRIAAERFEKANKSEEVKFKVGDRVKVTGGLYHWFKPGDIGNIVGINSDIEAEVRVGVLGQSIDFGDLELCTE